MGDLEKNRIYDWHYQMGWSFSANLFFAKLLQSLVSTVYQEGLVMFPQLEWWATKHSLTQSMIFIFNLIT